ncbi:MAG: DUF5615 family PIN-like protein [Gemmatales bacterium]
MKLLFDQNLSPKLVQLLADVFPDSVHVQSINLDSSDDDIIWEYALQNGLAIVTKDVDYNNLSILRGTPPKVVWLVTGNCTTRQVEKLLRQKRDELVAFDNDPLLGTYVIR